MIKTGLMTIFSYRRSSKIMFEQKYIGFQWRARVCSFGMAIYFEKHI